MACTRKASNALIKRATSQSFVSTTAVSEYLVIAIQSIPTFTFYFLAFWWCSLEKAASFFQPGACKRGLLPESEFPGFHSARRIHWSPWITYPPPLFHPFRKSGNGSEKACHKDFIVRQLPQNTLIEAKRINLCASNDCNYRVFTLRSN